jgi:hypothetical protein
MSASSFSLGITPASEFFVALTITMTRIVLLLRVGGCSGRGGRQGLLSSRRRTWPSHIDSARDLFRRARAAPKLLVSYSALRG